MSKNFVMALVLSFGILWGWEMVIMKRSRPAPPAPPAAALAPAPAAAPPGAPHPFVPPVQNLTEFDFGSNRLSVNAYGASVAQWWIQETDKQGRWTSLLPEITQAAALTTFPEVPFKVIGRSGNDISFEGRRADGLLIKKILRLDNERHLHRLVVALENTGQTPLSGDLILGWGPGLESGDKDPKEVQNSQRALVFEEPRLIKLKAGTHAGSCRWWGVDARYFLAAFLNPKNEAVSLDIKKDGKFFSVERRQPFALAPKETKTFEQVFYLGPKGYAQLASLKLSLEQAVDFGTFGGLGRLLLKVFYFLHGITGNYGWAVILLTVILQFFTFPLTVNSFKHTMKMRTIQPQLKRIQELHKGDPKRLNTEMLHLYQRHGLRFMGMEGCFPILIQLPVFWALYTTLRNAYELRHAPWVGWIRDLSGADPYYVLPVLMGGGMLLQQKMSAAALDPAQARMMYMMPVIFTFIFLKMPSGLVLYWFTNSLLTIALQAVLMKMQKQEVVPA